VAEPERLFKAGNVLILPHNDADPDAVASAFALSHLLMETPNMESTIAYQGIVDRIGGLAGIGCRVTEFVEQRGQPVRLRLGHQRGLDQL